MFTKMKITKMMTGKLLTELNELIWIRKHARKNFTKQNILLMNEASLSAMSLGVGLTFIRKYNYSQEGYLMHAFFSLSIGMERLMKLILLYDFRYKNGRYPNNSYLKNYSHDLYKLFNQINKIAEDYGLTELKKDIKKDSINIKIVEFFSSFAKYSRYYNLDELTGNFPGISSPVKEWNK